VKELKDSTGREIKIGDVVTHPWRRYSALGVDVGIIVGYKRYDTQKYNHEKKGYDVVQTWAVLWAHVTERWEGEGFCKKLRTFLLQRPELLTVTPMTKAEYMDSIQGELRDGTWSEV
jgi:hypothetical protein